MSFLEKHFKSLHIKIAKIDLKLKYTKHKLNQIVNKIISYVKKSKTQLFEFSKKYQEYFNIFHTLHSHLKKDDVKKSFRNSFKTKIKRIDSTIRVYKDFFRKSEKFREFDTRKVRKNRFFYKFFKVKNDNDDVQNAIDQREYKNRNKNREYCENRHRENEIWREKIKEFKNNNFIDFSKIN